MPRKAYTKGLEKVVFNREDNRYGKGRCWHCGMKLTYTKRKISEGFGAWHVDHYPVPYRDIETQYCCGVTDSNDAHNLVPSCISCNVGHQYERTKWYYCGRSQICFTKKCMNKIYWFFSLFIAFLLGMLFYHVIYNQNI
tara:strand:+ start:92 stop:508 length:417 start_codon:yes stop_codon:yes gene_type:complete